MPICNFLALNGQKSILAAGLVQQYGLDVATKMWLYAKAHLSEYTEFDVNGEPVMSQVIQATDNQLRVKIQEKLQKLFPEIKLTITNNPVWETGDNVFNQKDYSNQVRYRLKAVELLMSDKGRDAFVKGNKVGWDMTKILSELKIPKEQRQLIQDIHWNILNKARVGIVSDIREEIIADLLVNYGYTTEINTAKTKEVNNNPIDDDTRYYEKNGKYYKSTPYENEAQPLEISKEQYEAYITLDKPTQYYSNLTVPGGTNYTENEIRTPDITPSIKGHAAFATDKGIGWFRSDEQRTDDNKGKKVSDGAGGLVQLGVVTDSKTRRILEVQSDLFQKGRDKQDLVSLRQIPQGEGQGDFYDFNNYRYSFTYDDSTRQYQKAKISELTEENINENTWKEITKEEFESNKQPYTKENQLLQLLNKDNNWVTFFVKSIIQDSAKKGYEKVLFPSGNTVSKIEGHTTLEEFKKQKEDRLKVLEEELDNIPRKRKYFGENRYNNEIIGFDTKEEAEDFARANGHARSGEVSTLIQDNEREVTTLKQELERVEIEGFGALKPIYNFYEVQVRNTLDNYLGGNKGDRKKGLYKVKTITDDYGNTWNEVRVNPVRDLSNILLQRNEANQIIGQANIKAATVLIDAINQEQDTLPHEYAHHYIAWFRDTSIVQEAIKKWGSEEALVQSIGEQVVSQKGEAWNWWNDFVKWLMGKFKDLSTLKKQELTQLLTDAFLTRQDLSSAFQPSKPVLATFKTVHIGGIVKQGGERATKAELETQLLSLYKEAKDNSTIGYNIPYNLVSDTARLPNGYTAPELAELFDSIEEAPSNVLFTDSFKTLLSAQISSYAKEFVMEDQTKRQLTTLTGTTRKEQLNQLFVPIINGAGQQIGNFTTDKQIAAVDAVMWFVYKQIHRTPDIKVLNAFRNAMLVLQQKADRHEASEEHTQAADLREVLNSFAFTEESGRSSIAGLALQQLEAYGLSVKGKDKVLVGLEQDVLSVKAKQLLLKGTEFKIEDYKDIEEMVESLSEAEYTVEEGSTLRDYNDVVFELDPRDTASWRLKLFMANIEDTSYDLESSTGTKSLNYLGFPKLLNFDDTYEKVMGLLTNSKPSYESYDAKLRAAAKINPMFRTVADLLASAGIARQNEFVKVMTTHYQKFITLTHNTIVQADGSLKWILNPFETNRASQVLHLVKTWQEAQKTAPIMKLVAGERMIDAERMQTKWASWVQALDKMLNVYPKLDRATSDFEAKKNPEAKADAEAALGDLGLEIHNLLKTAEPKLTLGEFAQDPIKYAKHVVRTMLAEHGVDFTEEMVTDLTDNMSRRTKNTRYAKTTLGDQFAFNAEGIPMGMFSAFVWKAAGWSSATDVQENMVGDGSVPAAKVANPLYTDNTITKILARVAADHTEALTTASHRGGDGKVRFDYTLNSALTIRMQELTGDNFQSLYDEYQKVPFAKNNWLLNRWVASNQHGQADMMMMDTMRAVWQKKGTVRTEMSDREQMLMAVGLFQNRGKGTSHYMSLTHADKAMTPVFTNFPRVFTGTGDTTSLDAVKALYGVFEAEYNRIQQHWDTDFDHAQYNVGKKLFYLLPQFNYEGMVDLMNSKVVMNLGDGAPRTLTEEDISLLWAGTGATQRVVDGISPEARKVAYGMLNHFINELTTDTLAKWENAGITNKAKNLFNFDSTYITNLLQSTYKWKSKYVRSENSSNSVQTWWENGERKTPQEVYNAATKAAAKQFAVSYFMVNTSLSQLAYGDPAQVAKFKPEQLFDGALKPGQQLAVVTATFQEYAKRLAKDIAPGQSLHWKEKSYNTITIADVLSKEDYVGSKLAEAYGKVDGTDAQEYTTVAEHLSMLLAAGTIDDKVHEAMMKIVNDADGAFYKFEDPIHLAIIMQPVKPVYVGMRPEDRGTMFVDYVKSMSYPLYPPLTARFQIDGLRVHMEKNNVQRANFASAKKMGQPLNPLVLFDAKGKYIGDGNWENNIQTLSRDGFRIQQEVPYDEIKEQIKTITQMNKLIVESLAMLPNASFTVGSKVLSASEIRKLKEDIRIELINRNLVEFKKEIGMVGTELKDKTLVIDRIIEEARARGFAENEIAALRYKTKSGELANPLMFSASVDKFEGTILSMVKSIVDIKMAGKSYVQASSVGYVAKENLKTIADLSEVEKQAIVYVDGYDGTVPLRTMEKIGDVVKPAQVLAPFNFIVTNEDGVQVLANIEDYLIEDEVAPEFEFIEQRTKEELDTLKSQELSTANKYQKTNADGKEMSASRRQTAARKQLELLDEILKCL